MSEIPNCPKCNCEYVYEDGTMFVCPECAYEWLIAADETAIDENAPKVIRVGLENKFTQEYGTQDTLQKSVGLNLESIVKKILNYFKK